ncbi:hypothetical protein M4A00_002191, partial [Enterococcus faecium]|nr:hypothetical protein [Enterococcus faecium]
MESYGIRSVSKFNIGGAKIEVTRTENSTTIVGEILKTDSSIKIGNIEFTIFNCKYFKDKKSDIIVDGNPF